MLGCRSVCANWRGDEIAEFGEFFNLERQSEAKKQKRGSGWVPWVVSRRCLLGPNLFRVASSAVSVQLRGCQHDDAWRLRMCWMPYGVARSAALQGLGVAVMCVCAVSLRGQSGRPTCHPARHMPMRSSFMSQQADTAVEFNPMGPAPELAASSVSRNVWITLRAPFIILIRRQKSSRPTL